MDRKAIITCAGIAVALSAVVAPIAANAATSNTTATTSSASTAAADSITGITQKKSAYAELPRVAVTVTFGEQLRYELIDDAGRLVQSGSGSAYGPLTFNAAINGEASRDYTLVTTSYASGATSSRTFSVDLAGQRIAAPVDTTTDAQYERGTRQTTSVYRALPGATVEVTINGTTTSAVAGANGLATVPIALVVGENHVSAKQTLNGIESVTATKVRVAAR
jgi:hypothetical protein